MRILVRALPITGSDPMRLMPVVTAHKSARVLITAACALALGVGAVAVSPSSAQADDTITTQDYFSYYKLD